MRKMFLLLGLCTLYFVPWTFSQNVGIGTTTPNAKAALEVKATDKGILFPRLTTTQRNAISNPPNGLMIFNTDERCMNYYDSVYHFWNCYCADCYTVVINITDDVCNLDFYNQYAKYATAKKYIINISEDVYIHGCNPGDTALSFRNMAAGTSIIINNNLGFILGAGGRGGNGQIEQSGACPLLFIVAENGQAGGAAIATKAGVQVIVNNYGVIAGGGGGGGGSSKGASSGFGGGGGGGAGLNFGTGGAGGGVYTSTPCVPTIFAQAGGISTMSTPGNGGTGYNGGPAGGNGGNRGQAGQNGNTTIGGTGGKAIAGGSGNIINNLAGGQSFGIVD